MEMQTNQIELEIQKEAELLKRTYLTFGIAQQNYAVAVRYVIEIVRMQIITEIPDVPEYIRGVINLRGHVIPVMDTRTRFNLPTEDYTERTCIIVIKIAEEETGLIVERVNEVLQIPESCIQAPPPSWEAEHQQRFVQNLGRIEEQIVVLLNLEELISKFPRE